MKHLLTDTKKFSPLVAAKKDRTNGRTLQETNEIYRTIALGSTAPLNEGCESIELAFFKSALSIYGDVVARRALPVVT